jgi:hypothetical protein
VLIDTGTDPSAIDVHLAQRLALRLGGSGLGRGAASDTVMFTEAVLPWLRLGDLTIRDLFAPALDFSSLPFPLDVVLGYNVLRQLALTIDYRDCVLTLAHPELGAPNVSESGALMPLGFFEHFPALLNVEIDGNAVALATLDTGSNGALTVGPDVATQLGLLAGARGVVAGSGEGFGGGGDVLQRLGHHIKLGPFTLADVPIDTLDGTAGDFSRRGRVNIGNGLLSRFACVTLDYERRLMAVEPHGQKEGLHERVSHSH